ncbi:hypothetical protein [Thorsellia kenyensis]|uniref:ShlB/FhaC/HecB family hemolysin secretion/activation protein n=1 Tax=Thorsellia kenyensis TaxID=1549888 RepID=A0ABV6C6I4_9GAMM
MSISYVRFCNVFICMGVIHSAQALDINSNAIINQQQKIQQERQEARQMQLAEELPSVRFEANSGITSSSDYPVEETCFVINQIVIEERESLPQAIPINLIKASAEGLC